MNRIIEYYQKKKIMRNLYKKGCIQNIPDFQKSW